MQQNDQLGNIRPHADFFESAAAGTLPSVSWIMPCIGASEHPPGDIRPGQAWVTKIVNAADAEPAVGVERALPDVGRLGRLLRPRPPPGVDENGFGIRVPALADQPVGKPGLIDHQTLSFDAYLRFIEDRFLGGERLDPATLSRPDSRPTVRETVPILGDLATEFDFTQTPLPPLILDPRPKRPASPRPGPG